MLKKHTLIDAVDVHLQKLRLLVRLSESHVAEGFDYNGHLTVDEQVTLFAMIADAVDDVAESYRAEGAARFERAEAAKGAECLQ